MLARVGVARAGEMGAGLIDRGTDAPYERPDPRAHVVHAQFEDVLARANCLRLIVISENRLYREGLAHLLAAQPALDVVGTAGSAAELMLHDADVALVDVARPPGLRSVAELRRLRGDLPIVVVSVPELESLVVECAEAGVAGYVTTAGSAEELVLAARGVARGEVVCPPGVAAVLARRVAALASQRREPAASARLTLREREILRLIDERLSNKEIAQRLSLQVKTVKNHVSNILAKLGVANRAAAAAALHASDEGASRSWR
jgi:two-component system, NarL family, nitrate/nitrite response regulator NarL